jgi:hypothetical protein
MNHKEIKSNSKEASALSPLVEVTCIIRDTFGDAIEVIDKNYIEICQGVDEDDGCAVVDALEKWIPQFYKFTDRAAVLTIALEKLETLPEKLKASPSATELCKIVGAFLTFQEPYYRNQTYKTAMNKAMTADDGAVVNDFLQGDSLTKMKEVADACRDFVLLDNRLDEIGRFMNGEFDE